MRLNWLSFALTMAEETLANQLECAICKDTYTDPRVLKCYHAFCKDCLDKAAKRDKNDHLTLNCPVCNEVTSVSGKGVSDLEPANRIVQLLDIRECLESLIEFNGCNNNNAVGERLIFKCSEHTDKELALYCESCEKLICIKCFTKGGLHFGHDGVELHVQFQKYMGKITPLLKTIGKQIVTISSALMQHDWCCKTISDQQAALKENIHKAFAELHQVLDERKKELIAELDQETESKLQHLSKQRDGIETTLGELSSSLEFMKETLKKRTCVEVLMMKDSIERQVKMIDTFQYETLHPNVRADIAFLTSPDVAAQCENHGKLIFHVEPSYCFVVNHDALFIANVRETTTLLLKVVNTKNEPYEGPDVSLKCQLVSEITGTKGNVGTRRIDGCMYEVNYTPRVKGSHKLILKVEGCHIKGSPFSLAVKSPLEELGRPIHSIWFKAPSGVAVHHNGGIIATSDIQHRVTMFSPEGEEIQSFGEYGFTLGKFNSPCDVTVDSFGHILVADSDNRSVQRFTVNGQYKESSLVDGLSPRGITCTADKRVKVTDITNHCILILNQDLTISSNYGKRGHNKLEFKQPCGIACDNNGNVYVAEYKNNRVQVLSDKGNFVRFVSKRGKGRGDLKGPRSVAVDSNGIVYVSEEEAHRVSVFTSEGEFLTEFGKFGKDPGEFDRPGGIAVDSSGVVYVCDINNHRIQLF